MGKGGKGIGKTGGAKVAGKRHTAKKSTRSSI